MRDVGPIKDTVVACYPGATISKIADRLFDPSYPLQTYDIVILHVGTNDIWSRSADEIEDEFCRVVRKFRLVHPTGHVGFSCLLPRPRDEWFSKEKVINVNENLIRWCALNGCCCLRTFGPFTKNGRARKELFKQDGLHPSARGRRPTGLEVLTTFFRQQLSLATLRPRVQQLEKALRE